MHAPRNAEAPDVQTAEGINREGSLQPTSEAILPAYTLPVAEEFPQRIRVSDAADRYLERVADALVLNVFGLERLQGGMLALALAGSNWHSLETPRLRDRLARVEREADVWYWVANNPGKRPGDLHADTTREFWRQGADV